MGRHDRELEAGRALLAALFLGSVWFGLSSLAFSQEAKERSEIVCSELQNLDRPLSDSQLQTALLCQEVAKLHEERRTIQAANRAAYGRLGWLIPWTGIIAAGVSLIVAVVIPGTGVLLQRYLHRSQQAKLSQEKFLQEDANALQTKLQREAHDLQMTLQREAHNFELMKGLGESNNKSVQLASISSLLRRIEALRRNGPPGVEQTGEYRTIADIVVSVLRNPEMDVSVSKYVADEMIGVFDLRKGGAAVPTNAAPAALRQYNMQEARLSKAYWADVVADDVDFFGADLSGASLRGASMKRAVFYDTDLRKAVLVNACLHEANFYGADLRGARLDGADFTGASNLDAAQFDSATRWNEKTIWPAGFTPRIEAAPA